MRNLLTITAAATTALLLALLAPASVVHADPCGMVPPPFDPRGGPVIERIGVQATYVFYRKGVETFVIRPGFRGRVDNFGMLIPFPSPPTVRKVDDSIFTHIANAIDPPEVVVDANDYREDLNQAPGTAVMMNMAAGPEGGDASTIRVLSEEGVGMYQVAVLEAGSAAALKRWMDENGYVYPTGMDVPCEDYVEAGWCFVTVKTRVAGKSTVDPHAGQRDVPNPTGEFGFDGTVQAMGFRFRVDELVVPMRLSAFNEGELHNVIYLLTEGPRRVVGIPETHVRRQLSGADLYRNLTNPLPLRVLNGNWADIPSYAHGEIKARRNAEPHLGLARELFVWDLHASETGQLIHGHEVKEKQLLDISERLGLRGAEIDTVHAGELAHSRPAEPAPETLAMLKDMTLTIVDGNFQREVLADANLTFASYQMPAGQNHPRHYNAVQFGPGWRDDGVRYDQPNPVDSSSGWVVALLVAIGLGASIASYIVIRSIRSRVGNSSGSVAAGDTPTADSSSPDTT
jgi:Uncharacterized protein conserved in bacteria (DUF2330)